MRFEHVSSKKVMYDLLKTKNTQISKHNKDVSKFESISLWHIWNDFRFNSLAEKLLPLVDGSMPLCQKPAEQQQNSS